MGLGAGQIALDVDLSALVTKTYQKPIGRALQAAQQVVPVTTQTAFIFGAEDYDTHGFHSTSVNTGRVTPTIPGYYRFTAMVFWTTAAGGVHQIEFRKNGVTRLPCAVRQTGDASGNWSMGPIPMTQPMNGTTDYIEITAILQAALTTTFSFPFVSTLEWEFVRDL